MKNWKKEIDNSFAPVIEALNNRAKMIEEELAKQKQMLEDEEIEQDDYMDYIDKEVEAIRN